MPGRESIILNTRTLRSFCQRYSQTMLRSGMGGADFPDPFIHRRETLWRADPTLAAGTRALGQTRTSSRNPTHTTTPRTSLMETMYGGTPMHPYHIWSAQRGAQERRECR